MRNVGRENHRIGPGRQRTFLSYSLPFRSGQASVTAGYSRSGAAPVQFLGTGIADNLLGINPYLMMRGLGSARTQSNCMFIASSTDVITTGMGAAVGGASGLYVLRTIGLKAPGIRLAHMLVVGMCVMVYGKIRETESVAAATQRKPAVIEETAFSNYSAPTPGPVVDGSAQPWNPPPTIATTQSAASPSPRPHHKKHHAE